MRNKKDIYTVFSEEGFSELHEIARTARFTDPSSREDVYINLDRLPRQIHIYRV